MEKGALVENQLLARLFHCTCCWGSPIVRPSSYFSAMFVCLPFAVRLFVCVCRPKSACQHRSKIARFSNHNTERNIMCTVIKRMYSISRSYKPDERRWLFLGALSFLKHYKLFIIYKVQERLSIFFFLCNPHPEFKIEIPNGGSVQNCDTQRQRQRDDDNGNCNIKAKKIEENQARQPHLRRSWLLLPVWVFFSAGNLVFLLRL